MATIEERAKEYVYKSCEFCCGKTTCCIGKSSFEPCISYKKSINAYVNGATEQDSIARQEERERCIKAAKECFCLTICKGHPHRSTCTSLGTCSDYDEFCAMFRKAIEEGGNQ